MNRAFSAACAAVALLAACDPSRDATGVVCAPAVDRALRVEVRDSITNAGIASAAGGSAVEGAFRDTLTPLTPGDSLVIASAQSRAGIYRVTVTRPGYREWVRDTVHVTGGVCGVQSPRIVVARMQRVP